MLGLPPRYGAAVGRLVDHLPLQEVNWALTGSVGHRLQGVEVDCHDIDVQTDEAGAYEVARRLAPWVVEPVALRASPRLESHFGRLHFQDLDVDVEVMGALRTHLPGGVWTPPTDPADHRLLVPLGPRRVPVLSLQYEAGAYERLGRHDRARLLRRVAGI